MAETALGKQAEVLARGDLARNGLEQILAVNRNSSLPDDSAGTAKHSGIPIIRAVVLQNVNGKWSEVLRCDEYLKNPTGYLGGSPPGRVTGWRLQYAPDTKQGLELKFTPAEADSEKQISISDGAASQSLVVRWNAGVKRYQSMDRAQERFLNEVPTLETPPSILSR